MASKRYRGGNKRRSGDEFVQRALVVHEGKYSYDAVEYRGSRNKVAIECPTHGTFMQTPAKHLYGRGCPKCAIVRNSDRKRKTTRDVIANFRRVHGNRYDYSLVVYTSTHKKLRILCRDHGEFRQSYVSHFNNGSGCPTCGNEVRATKKRVKRADLIEKCRLVHGEQYDYAQLSYKTMHDQVEIICRYHGVFQQRLYHHLAGHGCPQCKSSLGEQEVSRFLAQHGIEYVAQWRDHDCRPNLRIAAFDFYLPERNTIIEYDGIQHFQPVAFGGGTDPEEMHRRVVEADTAKKK